MRNPLHKSLKKEFLRNRSRYISLSLVLILMIGVVTGFLSVAYSAKELLIKDQISSKVEDGQLALRDRMDVKTKTKLEALGLKVYEQFYTEQSISRDTPFAVGINGASGGRSIPLIRPTSVCPPTSIAPELPADTNASASPFFTSFIPTTMDESFFLRIAFTGGSAVSITSVAPTT